jgi:hypothetical protein
MIPKAAFAAQQTASFYRLRALPHFRREDISEALTARGARRDCNAALRSLYTGRSDFACLAVSPANGLSPRPRQIRI